MWVPHARSGGGPSGGGSLHPALRGDLRKPGFDFVGFHEVGLFLSATEVDMDETGDLESKVAKPALEKTLGRHEVPELIEEIQAGMLRCAAGRMHVEDHGPNLLHVDRDGEEGQEQQIEPDGSPRETEKRLRELDGPLRCPVRREDRKRRSEERCHAAQGRGRRQHECAAVELAHVVDPLLPMLRRDELSEKLLLPRLIAVRAHHGHDAFAKVRLGLINRLEDTGEDGQLDLRPETRSESAH